MDSPGNHADQVSDTTGAEAGTDKLKSEVARLTKANKDLAYRAWVGWLFPQYLHDATHRLTSLAMDASTLIDRMRIFLAKDKGLGLTAQS